MSPLMYLFLIAIWFVFFPCQISVYCLSAKKKHAFGSEGTVAGMGCQTLDFVGWVSPKSFYNFPIISFMVLSLTCIQRQFV